MKVLDVLQPCFIAVVSLLQAHIKFKKAKKRNSNGALKSENTSFSLSRPQMDVTKLHFEFNKSPLNRGIHEHAPDSYCDKIA